MITLAFGIGMYLMAKQGFYIADGGGLLYLLAFVADVACVTIFCVCKYGGRK